MELSKEFAFVGLVAIQHTLTLTWMGLRVGGTRKKFQIKYPTMYACVGEGNIKDEKALAEYNCTQRGHQNTLEGTPTFLTLLFLASLSFPTFAAMAGSIYSASRIFYFLGYRTGDPKKRARGNFGYLGLISLLGLAIGTCVKPFL